MESINRAFEVCQNLLSTQRECRVGTALDHVLLICTHHKTGTKWMKKVFSAICEKYSWRFQEGDIRRCPSQCDVFLNWNSQVITSQTKVGYRGLHLIRDPRDVIVSGAFYHQTASEDWLHKRRLGFIGRTYQQAINRQESIADKIRFEMEHASGQVIRDMLNWNYSDPDIIECRYEDLIIDVELREFRRIFIHLGFPSEAMDEICEIAWKHSLFSGEVTDTQHIRSGQPGQWAGIFDRSLRYRFLELFGDALVRLGYEPNDAWCN